MAFRGVVIRLLIGCKIKGFDHCIVVDVRNNIATGPAASLTRDYHILL